MKKIIYLTLIMLISASCASQTKKSIEMEKEAMPTISSNSDMISKMGNILDNAKGITPKQKEKIIAIHERNLEATNQIHQDIRKLKVILFKDVMAKDFNEKKVFQTKKQIEQLYKERVKIMTDSFNEVARLLGKYKTDFFNDRVNEHVFQEMHLRY